MRFPLICGFLFAATVLFGEFSPTATADGYTHLTAADVTVQTAARAFPGGGYSAENILPSGDGRGTNREYASHGLGAETFIEFDLGAAVPVAAFRHIQRQTPDTIATSELIFSNAADFQGEVGRVTIQHVDEPGATTLSTFPRVQARYVRWQVTSVLPERSPNVGGRQIEFFVAADTSERPEGLEIEAKALPIINRRGEIRQQPLQVSLSYPYAESVQAVVRVSGQEPQAIPLHFGTQELSYTIPAVAEPRSLDIEISVDDKAIAKATVGLPAARQMTVYILPHSHTDIGYTAIQTDIEDKQIYNLLQGIAAARRTADYPEGSRFIWNVEVAWAAHLFLERLPPQHRDEFWNAVKQGQVALHGMYLNELTGLCRPEELVRLFRYAAGLSQRTGIPIDAAMISDVPGYTWGTVTAMNQAGIRYFSVAPNYFDRMGDILVQWENRPFWWVGPDGTSRVLVWIPFRGYATSHIYGKLSPEFVEEFCRGLETREYPFDIAYLRWAGHGDNAVPDATICDFVKEWNAEYDSPRFIISSTSEAFRAFEQRYGDQLPEMRGDWTPYWEDGAGSSAAETALNRASSERLTQAESLWAMLAPSRYPVHRFEQAWQNVLLYSEHTWGAHCSISQPANPFTSDQWNIKQSYATAANLQSRQLLNEAAQNRASYLASDSKDLHHTQDGSCLVDLYNTTSWPRSEVAILSQELSLAGDAVTDERGHAVASQRLASGELAVLIRDLPPLSGRRLRISRQGTSTVEEPATAVGQSISNGKLSLQVDPQTGGIAELVMGGLPVNLVDRESGQSLNDYLYLIGDDPAKIQRTGPVQVTVRDRGPLVASLLVESTAPGCHKLTREIRLAAGADHAELINTVDKKRIEADSYHADEGKESVNFAFPFHVPNGNIRLDVPLGVVRPEQDQIPSACKNWLTIGRWADVANKDFGVTWITLDAPLLQVGGITATLLNSQSDPSVWRTTIEPTQKLYCWAMNNHWGTNYRAYQMGPVVFRFILRPHSGLHSDAEITRFAAGYSQPLIAVPGHGAAPDSTPLLQVDAADVIVTSLKPSDDGKALIVRLLGVSNEPQNTRLTWGQSGPSQMSVSDTSERATAPIDDSIRVPAWGLVTIRAEWPIHQADQSQAASVTN